MAKKRSAVPFLKFIKYSFKILGVATMTVDANFHFKSSKPGIAYNILLIILVFIGTYFGINLSYFSDFAERAQLEKIADTVHTLILICTTLFILTLHCVRQKEIIKFANDLRRFVDVSSTLCRKRTYDEKSRKIIKELRMIAIFNLASMTFWLVTMPTDTSVILLYFIFVTIFNFVINTFVVQYTFVISLISHLFDVLNSSLTEMTDHKSDRLEISFVQKHGLQLKLSKLTQCREFFTSLSRVSRKISKFMEMIMLVCISNVFVTLTMYSYYLMKEFITERYVIPTSVMMHNISQLFYTLATTVLLTSAGSCAINKSKRTGEIVNECLHSEGFLCHPDLANQLNLFSNYLLHKNLRFGVCNLFVLDESLLMSIAGSITTYLVILLQFKQSNKT